MENLILIIVISILNIVCFFIGAKVGQKVVNQEPLEIPTPAKIYEEHKERAERNKLVEETKIMLENVDNYTGDGTGQKDV